MRLCDFQGQVIKANTTSHWLALFGRSPLELGCSALRRLQAMPDIPSPACYPKAWPVSLGTFALILSAYGGEMNVPFSFWSFNDLICNKRRIFLLGDTNRCCYLNPGCAFPSSCRARILWTPLSGVRAESGRGSASRWGL